MFPRPFGLYCSACFGILFVSTLCTCCSNLYILDVTSYILRLDKVVIFRNFHNHLLDNFFMGRQPLVSQGLWLFRLHNHTQTHYTRWDSSGWMISPSQKPLPGNTQHSQKTDVYVPGGIRTRNPSKLAAADPYLRPRGHWDQPFRINRVIIKKNALHSYIVKRASNGTTRDRKFFRFSQVSFNIGPLNFDFCDSRYSVQR
jgi:hypothetical protein